MGGGWFGCFIGKHLWDRYSSPARLLEKTDAYEDMKKEAKERLKASTEVKTVKSLREK
ncbi:hypothetical protein [Shouchella shacheensis]|uniref:hypothetical protein n=1 Tax=Shouchella shacheensis TaxID=1649580 RepID=UPI000AB3780C|nr:hypothetical protein [Shouchella shacheensis]